jgi:subtilisin-like proprotein convertase family protein
VRPLGWIIIFFVLLLYPFIGVQKATAQYGGGVCTTFTSTDVPKTISDGGTVTSTINATGVGTLVWVNVLNLNISHNNDTDLDVFLTSPASTQVMLFTDVGGSGNNFTNTNFYQNAGTPITSGSSPFTGWYSPEGNLNNFIGQNGTGTWTLRLTDDNTNGTGGTLNGWQLQLCQPIPTVTNTPTPTRTPTPTPLVPTPTTNPNAVGTIIANPNPCQIPTADIDCDSNIGWSTSGGVIDAEVWYEDAAGGGEIGFDSDPTPGGGPLDPVGNKTAVFIESAESGHAYTFRLYNTSGGGRQLLHEVLVTGNPSTNDLPEGSHETATDPDCRTTGWTYDPDDTGNPIRVRIYRDSPPPAGTLVHEAFTDVFRNLSGVGGPTGAFGFDVRFQATSGLFDGTQHDLYAYGVDANNGINQILFGSPLEIDCGTATPTPTEPPTDPSGRITGRLLVDGTTGYDGADIRIYATDGTLQDTDITSGGGFYDLDDPTQMGDKTVVIWGGLSGNLGPSQVDLNSAGWQPWSSRSFTFPFVHPPSGDYTLDWWLTNASGWTQIEGGGDVRQKQITETIPGTETGTNDPSTGLNDPRTVYFSSDLPGDFGDGIPGAPLVNSEYGYNSDPRTHTGFFSYTFFENRRKVVGIDAANVVELDEAPFNCSSSSCNLTGLQPEKIYRYDDSSDPDLRITSYSHPSPGHVLLLVNGNLTIATDINNVLPAVGNLLVIAAKGNVTIDESVGGAPSATGAHIQAVLTSEKSIILDGDRCGAGAPDLRLNFEGSIVTNSLKPFATNQPGVFVRNRSLCADDANFPVLTIRPRYDFVTQLTDFYKIPSIRWKEVAP